STSLPIQDKSLPVNGYYSPIQGYRGKTRHHAKPSYHGRHSPMQVQATQGRPNQVMLSCKHPLMLVQANHWKGTIAQSMSIHEIY
ncbi:hypothetical protein H5410_041468, partial [Solanum commersonii]